MRTRIVAMLMSAIGGVAAAQTAPSASEVARYEGLHRAAHAGEISEIRRLLATGADVLARDGNGRTPAHVAAFASQDSALAALAEGGADLNALDHDRYDVATIAAVADDVALLRLALSLGNRADLVTSVWDGTALIAAAHLGHHEAVKALIEAGAPLDHVNNLGWTALMEAVILGDGGADHLATVEALLAAGADRSITDKAGLTPLMQAERHGYTNIAKALRRAQ